MIGMRIKNVINCSGHPLSKDVIKELENKGCVVETVSVGVDLKGSLSTQIRKLVDSIKTIPIDGTVPFAITLPGLSEVAVFLMAILHGRCGFFPKILQVRKGKLGTFEIATFSHPENLEPGVVDLEWVRLKARGDRFKQKKEK